MQNWNPVPKVTAGLLAGSATVVIVYVLGMFGIHLPNEVSSAVTTILTFAASWFTPSEQMGE